MLTKKKENKVITGNTYYLHIWTDSSKEDNRKTKALGFKIWKLESTLVIS
jgi:hypothetical protein